MPSATLAYAGLDRSGVHAPVGNQAAASLAAGAALGAAPLSIAVSEIFLAIALVLRLYEALRLRKPLGAPRVFRFWLLWAGLEVVVWLGSPEKRLGLGEIRHLALIAALFIILPALNERAKLQTWKAVLISASVGSGSVVVGFILRAIRYRGEIAAGGDPAFYLRNGGLLHHWMVYAVVEVVVFGALLEFRLAYPEEYRWTTPALVVNSLAVLLSLTRCLWLACFCLLALHWFWRRSKWALLLPVAPVVLFLLAPAPIRDRVTKSTQPDYYSNAERVQMWRVGWKMIRERPLVGVGAGRVDGLYTSYLSPGEPAPAYHGHLHNNALQLGAQFGLPVLAAAVLCLAVIIRDLMRALRAAAVRRRRFLSRSALLAITGFLITGMMDYTYGHSLGLILLAFAILSPREC